MNRRKDGNIARERAIVATRGTILDDVERAAGDHIVVFEGIVCTDINVTVTDRTIVFKSAHCYIEGAAGDVSTILQQVTLRCGNRTAGDCSCIYNEFALCCERTAGNRTSICKLLIALNGNGAAIRLSIALVCKTAIQHFDGAVRESCIVGKAPPRQ